MDPSQLPITKSDYLKLISLCMHFGGLTFNSEEYLQHSGLAMGSPLSPVAACLYMEWLEKNHFQVIMGQDVVWMRYVDDVLVVVPQDMDLGEKLREINGVDPHIQFTLEQEKQGSIPFLDTRIERAGREVKFRVYRKPTHREDYVHFYSGHTDKVKRGIVLGFFLRAFRICSTEYLEEEIKHIMSSFARLKYPKGLLINLRKKAVEIRNRSKTKKKETKKDSRHISIPNSKLATTIANRLEKTGVRVALTSGRKLKEMLGQRKDKSSHVNSVVYRVPCGVCDKSYIGETGRGIETRLKEHKRDLRYNREYSAFVDHADKTHHLPNWDGAAVVTSCKSKTNRKAIEAAYILLSDTINMRAGFIKWAKPAAVLSVSEIKR